MSINLLIQPLAGGFVIGDVVYSTVSHAKKTGSIVPGSRGVVQRGGDPPNALTHVEVKFDSGLLQDKLPTQVTKDAVSISISLIYQFDAESRDLLKAHAFYPFRLY